MKLIIDIPEWVIDKDDYTIYLGCMSEKLYEILRNGTPLVKHDEEVITETVASIWDKPPYTEVLDSIKAEIEQYQADCDLSCSDDANCRTCDRITFDTIYRIIDKYRKGQTDADSD